jgi:glucan phosphoethanolaminetransferase (alkaline phosphatase superfamily)
MGKKKDLTESESDTDTDTESTDTNSDKKNNSIIDKINKLSRKAKLYIGICVVLLLAGLYMWYKNKKNNGQTIQNEYLPIQTNQTLQQIQQIQQTQQTQQIQQTMQTMQTGGQEVMQTIQPILSHLTPNPLED